ncbi:hypothetical protein [Monoglobus pectinilyticus]|jgi:hypothetical protein|uniref:RNA polymerase subunit sigma-24 n=1 Tax=Monoglobus pectinilyticus TaxID=1981510 RepID=A0A2K9P072_9FIRM|nr:hypothetical protein [Monoglobus pectinilyticus]AUO18670.1 RNA polymerase subunit sigma-24 [Monoglobus pectinilyticus]
MTAERLRQYKSIKAEIEELAEQIQMLESSDIVQGSDREFPYIKHNMKVETAECDRTRELLRKELQLLKTEYRKLNEFINNIADSEIRRIFRYRYIEGWTFQKIAFRMNETDESYPRRKHNKYLKNIKVAENAENHML